MKILVINGPNINMLGIRERNIYGSETFDTLIETCIQSGKELGVEIECYQSNHEGDLVDKIQSAYQKVDGIVINPGAYTHTLIALLDALKSVSIPTVEVHITEVNEREEFRKISFVKEFAYLTITGKGFAGYIEALLAPLP